MPSRPSDEFACERPDIFAKLQETDWFVRFIAYQTSDVLREGGFLFEFSEPRLHDAFALYHRDIAVIGELAPEWRGLTHFLYCGHLCYWLRRSSPIIAMHERAQGGEPGYREFLKTYGNEFVAFEVGFRICRFFEARRADLYAMLDALARKDDRSIARISLSTSLLAAVTRTLKEQSVSAPALALVYRALFLDLRSRRQAGP